MHTLPARRLAIFAHYDVDGLIDSYVLHYLRGLHEVAATILFVSASDLKQGEAAKLDGIAELVFAGDHGAYDFGSWRRGFEHLGDGIADWDEVILANDSCFAPVFPLTEIFSRMASVECDAWGNSACAGKDGLDYVSSYFLVFRRPVLRDARFRCFWAGLTPAPAESARRFAEGAERKVSHRLMEWGYRLASYIPQSRDHLMTMQGYYVRQIVPMARTPWLKIKMFTENPCDATRIDALLPRVGAHYPRHLIDGYVARRLGTAEPPHYRYAIGRFQWPSPRARAFRLVGKTNRRSWKVNLHIFGIHFPVLLLPLPRRRWR